jgi:anti-sigma factor RsiW
MITCRKFSIYISQYIDNEVTQEIREEIEEHIEYCPVCQKTHHAFSRLITFCHYCCQKEVPEETHNNLWDALQGIISAEIKPKPKPRRKARRTRKKTR